VGKYKVYIIDEVHMLTKEAFNALLKTLEEPPSHVVFIMATTDAYKVPVTITSRAQTYAFKLADAKTMFDYLKTVADKEKIQIADDALEMVVRRGGGSFRDSLSLLDQLSILSDKETTDLYRLVMKVQNHFSKLYEKNPDNFALDIEFKVMGANRKISVKQVRPYIM
jgi:DNA polymerase-3 subunit gamma/tau